MRKLSIADTLITTIGHRRPANSLLFLLFFSLISAGSNAAHLSVRSSAMHLFQAGNIRVTGKILSASGEPLAGASVSVKGTTNSVASDALGSFTISAPDNGTLVVSYIGYASQEIAVAGQTSIGITLAANGGGLNEVIVVGYSSQKRSNISGAVGTVSMIDAEKRRVSDVAQTLQGQVAGVQVTQSTGAPGDPIEIRIRGLNTTGDNNPLFVVDGVPTTDIRFLNPSDIQSMTVLKDASSAAIYGSRASAGVILITTKKGVKGKSSLSLNAFTGIQQAVNLPKMLNSKQYLDIQEEAWNNSGYSGTNPYTTFKSSGTNITSTNWLDELFERGVSNNVQLSASGGSDKVQYLLSGDYYSQNGIVIFDNDRYRRYNFRVNVNANVTDRLTMGTNLQVSYANQDALSSKGDVPGIIRHALLRPPVLSVYKDKTDPTFTEKNPFTDLPFYTRSPSGAISFNDQFERSQNPIALAYYTDDRRNNFRTFGNVFGEYSFLGSKALKFRTSLGIDRNMLHNKAFHPNFGDDDGGNSTYAGQGRINRPNSLSDERNEEVTLTWNNTLNYAKTVNKHSINVLAGTEFIKNNSSGVSASRTNFEYDERKFRYIDFGGTTKDVWNGGTGSEWSLFSYLASATYVYDSKYMLTANFRADASSRFGPDNKWGYYPSVSAGWTLSEEDFLKSVNWLSYLKLRASTGKLGNQNIPNYSYENLYKKVGEEYQLVRFGNPGIKWESTMQNDIGLDIGILKNKLSFTLDYFEKTTSDILLTVSLPVIVGNVMPTYINAAEVKNKGFELGINYSNNINKFTYRINANAATLKNEVIKLHPNLPALVGPITKSEPGHPLNAYYGLMMDGIYQTSEEVSSHLFNTLTPSEKPGDIKFRDIDKNGVIDDNDRTYMGNPIPRFTYGANFSAGLMNFDFAMLWQGVQDVDRYNDGKKIIDYDTRPFNHSTDILDRWHGAGTSNTVPRVTMSGNGGSRTSSVFVEDASYLRLKNVELGYSLTSLAPKVFQSLRIYISGQNIFTFTKYKGLDPESTDLIDMGTYPQSRAFLMGVNVRF